MGCTHLTLYTLRVLLYILLRLTPDDFTRQRETPWGFKGKETISLNPLHLKSALIDFTPSNARRFNSSKGDSLGLKGLKKLRLVCGS